MPEREHRRERPEQRGDAVAERERRQRRRAVGLAVDVGEAADRLGHRPEARAAARTGPVWPNPEQRTMTSRGLMACRTSGPQPQRSSVPGPEALDEHVGVDGQLA